MTSSHRRGRSLHEACKLEELGTRDGSIIDQFGCRFRRVEQRPGIVRGPIVSIDHFGSCRTFIGPNDLPASPERVTVRCGRVAVRGIVQTYGDVPQGRTLALFGSYGGLEISVARWRCRKGLGARARHAGRGFRRRLALSRILLYLAIEFDSADVRGSRGSDGEEDHPIASGHESRDQRGATAGIPSTKS